MKNCLIALLGLLSTPALAQQGQLGEWETWFFFGDPTNQTVLPIVAMHLIHVNTGKVLAITFGEPNNQLDPCEPACDPYPGSGPCVGKIYLWTPSQQPGNPGQFQSIPNCRNYLFCTGHSALADGRILVAGSEWAYFSDVPFADLYDPSLPLDPVFAWNFPSPPPNMAYGRWYPTATTLGDGKVLVTSGTYVANGTTNWVIIPELYNPAPAPGTWTRLLSASRQQPYYPYMFVLPDGNLVAPAGLSPRPKAHVSLHGDALSGRARSFRRREQLSDGADLQAAVSHRQSPAPAPEH